MVTMQPFHIKYRGQEVKIIPKKIGTDTVFVVQFAWPAKALVLSKALRQEGNSFWTTIPEEKIRTKQDAALLEAAQIGAQITEYYRATVTT